MRALLITLISGFGIKLLRDFIMKFLIGFLFYFVMKKYDRIINVINHSEKAFDNHKRKIDSAIAIINTDLAQSRFYCYLFGVKFGYYQLGISNEKLRCGEKLIESTIRVKINDLDWRDNYKIYYNYLKAIKLLKKTNGEYLKIDRVELHDKSNYIIETEINRQTNSSADLWINK